MQFKTQQDVAAEKEQVFAAVGDFSRLERLALRRGIDVVRVGQNEVPEQAAWRLTFDMRGKTRTINARVVRHDAPNGYAARGASDGIEIELNVELISLSKTRTRLVVTTDLKPKTIAAKLLVQSMRLAKGNLDRRYAAAIASHASKIEGRDNL